MYKTDKRLTNNHLTPEEVAVCAKQTDELNDIDDKAEYFEIEFETAGLLERIKTKKASNQQKQAVKVVQSVDQTIQ